MRSNTLRFILISLGMLSLIRGMLALWQWDRVESFSQLLPMLLGGLRIDLTVVVTIACIPLLLSPWLGHLKWASVISAYWFRLGFLILVFMELATPQFILEFDSRPNRLFLEYLNHPEEIFGMLWEGYKPVLAVVTLVLAVAIYLSGKLFPMLRDKSLYFWLRPAATIVFLLVAALAIRGTLQHRPINPALVAFSSDNLLNSLTLNSFYSAAYAGYRLKNESQVSKMYGKLPEDEINSIVRTAAGLSASGSAMAFPSQHFQQASNATLSRPHNLVIIVEESLGAQYVGALGGKDLTPRLDALSEESWWFENIYATGTRSARGLEAITTGFLPTPSRAVLKLSRSQGDFFTLGRLLGSSGYNTRFIYGGESHFDNMKGFFLSNGFSKVHDLNSFTDPAFIGSWGASDEDMFNELDQMLASKTDTPELIVAFSVTNHSPWEYPEGRIKSEGETQSVENTIRYADWALGEFFKKAKKQAYWKDTVFLVVADHDSRVSGASAVPVKHFQIPALILGADIPVKKDPRLVSQIDLAPTVLSMIGVSAHHPMPGQDLSKNSPDRAILQYGEVFGYLQKDQLLVLRPNAPAEQYVVNKPDFALNNQPVDPQLQKIALAHALWPNLAYLKGWYSASSYSPEETRLTQAKLDLFPPLP